MRLTPHQEQIIKSTVDRVLETEGDAVSLAYLPEHAENAMLVQELAKKEAANLPYTRTLFAQHINLQWVQALVEREDLVEKINAFVSRFGRPQKIA